MSGAAASGPVGAPHAPGVGAAAVSGADLAGPRDAEELLLAYCRGRDVPCPRCGYNLRDAVRSECPECREALRLTVGRVRVPLLWFVLSLTPGMFGGVLTLLMGAAIAYDVYRSGWVGFDTAFLLIVGFNAVSALVACCIFAMREKFLALPRGRQISFAAAIWATHLFVFVGLIAVG